MTNITITLSFGSMILGFIVGIAVISFALWLSERDINRDNQFHVGFSKGWDRGREYAEEFEQKYIRGKNDDKR